MKPFNVLLLIVLSLPALAQSSSGISGTVLDQRSNPVPGATIYVLNTGRAAITDNQGAFAIAGLPSGRYTIRITAVGFAALSRQISTEETGIRFNLSESA